MGVRMLPMIIISRSNREIRNKELWEEFQSQYSGSYNIEKFSKFVQEKLWKEKPPGETREEVK